MEKVKKVFAIIILLVCVNGCHTHFHVTPTFSPKMQVNPAVKDTLAKTDTITIKNADN